MISNLSIILHAACVWPARSLASATPQLQVGTAHLIGDFAFVFYVNTARPSPPCRNSIYYIFC
jgi:hypothetical protein